MKKQNFSVPAKSRGIFPSVREFGLFGACILGVVLFYSTGLAIGLWGPDVVFLFTTGLIFVGLGSGVVVGLPLIVCCLVAWDRQLSTRQILNFAGLIGIAYFALGFCLAIQSNHARSVLLK